jgi:hypothetical protein
MADTQTLPFLMEKGLTGCEYRGMFAASRFFMNASLLSCRMGVHFCLATIFIAARRGSWLAEGFQQAGRSMPEQQISQNRATLEASQQEQSAWIRA